MLKITEAKVLEQCQIFLAFSDGIEGTLDLSDLAGRGVFQKLRDPDFMDQLYIDRESGTIAWPGGLDLDPVVLYSKISHKPIEESLHRYYA
jgi:hypothetical protein